MSVVFLLLAVGSLSARRAWIEIFITQTKTATGCVALRKESVDRNTGVLPHDRRKIVALRKESVDRNLPMCFIRRLPLSRSPQGERG